MPQAVVRHDDDVLDALEDEAIWAIREAISGFMRPVILYSIGKDSTVLIHLAAKAFAPAPIPAPVLHIDTGWKFREMIEFRDQTALDLQLDLVVHSNQEGVSAGVSPFNHGSDEYTRVMKTMALRQALEHGRYDVALGGARIDEERSRAKERMFSVRSVEHVWDPRNQRPEFWSTVNSTLRQGQTMRAFPLSNWTEIDIWRYIRREDLKVVPLYFAAERPTVLRDGKLIVVDDDRFVFAEGEKSEMRRVRFRTLGCYPLSASEMSDADSIDRVIDELQSSQTSERAGRLIDGSGSSSMENKKLEGYF